MTKLKCCDIKDDMYEIDEYGNIYSHTTKKNISAQTDRDGYLRCMLSTNSGKRRDFRIHRLVAYTFLGNPPDDMINPTVNHIDRNRSNNYYKNLEWKEHGENASEKDRSLISGEKNGRAKLTNEQVIAIKYEFDHGESINNLAEKYSVNSSVINSIKNGTNWSSVTNKEFIGLKDMYEILPWGKKKILKLLNEGEIPAFKVGRDYITEVETLKSWIRNNYGNILTC